MLDGYLAAGTAVRAPHAPQAGICPAANEGLLGTGGTEAQQRIRAADELLVGERVAAPGRLAIQCRLQPGHIGNHMLVAHGGEVTGQGELGGVLAVQGVGVQAVAMPGVLQCGALQFQRSARRRGVRRRQQCLRQRGRGAGAEALVGVSAHATRGSCALGVGRIFGFGAGGQLDHADDLGGGRWIEEAGIAELDLRRVDPAEAGIGGQQQHRCGRLLHDRIGLAVAGEQRTVSQVQAEAAQRVGGGAVVADGDVHGVIAHGLAAEGGDALDLAGQCGEPRGRHEGGRGQADLGDQHGVGAGVRRIDQLGEAGIGDFQAHAGVTLRSVEGGGRPWRGRLQVRRRRRRPACPG